MDGMDGRIGSRLGLPRGFADGLVDTKMPRQRLPIRARGLSLNSAFVISIFRFDFSFANLICVVVVLVVVVVAAVAVVIVIVVFVFRGYKLPMCKKQIEAILRPNCVDAVTMR